MILNDVYTQPFFSNTTDTIDNRYAIASAGSNFKKYEPEDNPGSLKVTLTSQVENGRGASTGLGHTKEILEAYRSRVAEDLVFIKEKIKEKITEYNLSAGVTVSVKMTASGRIEVAGSMTNPILAMIEVDLNKSEEMKRALLDHQDNVFLVKYIDRVRMIQAAYGQANNVVNRLRP